MRAVDVHVHPTDDRIARAWAGDAEDAQRFFRGDWTHEDLDATAARYAGLDTLAVLLGADAETTTGVPAYPNDELAAACRKYPERFIGFAGIDPWKGQQAIRELERCVRELGLKGVSDIGLQYSTALFATSVHDELIPFDIPGGNGRRYYRNAGRTSRRGVELGLTYDLHALELGGAYTYANYRFVDFTVGTADYAGNRIPGIPAQTLQASATFRTRLASLVTEANFADRMFVNDGNSESAPGYGIVNARLVSSALWRGSGAEVTVGAQNIFDRKYVSSVSVNASAGKFYEPGSQRAFFVGLSLVAAAHR